jgi:hypothetical protein
VLVRSGGAVVQYRRKHMPCRQIDGFWSESVSERGHLPYHSEARKMVLHVIDVLTKDL